MLQDMDHLDASCVFYVEVGTLLRLEQSKIYVSTITGKGIALLNVHHFESVSCKIYGISWDKHHQTSFLSKNVLWISHKPDISAVVHRDVSL